MSRPLRREITPSQRRPVTLFVRWTSRNYLSARMTPDLDGSGFANFFEGVDQVRCAIQAAFGQIVRCELVRTVSGQNHIDRALVFGSGCCSKCECYWSESELKQPISGAGLQIIVALWKGFRDQSDLRVDQAEAAISLTLCQLKGARIWQENPRWAGLTNRGSDLALRDISERLGGENDGHVLFA